MRPIGCALFAVSLGLSALAAEAQKSDLAAADPFRIVRTQSPYGGMFVREEYLSEHLPGLPERSHLNRFSVILKERQALLLDTSYRKEMETWFERYEWKDITGDGQPELLVYDGDGGPRHRRSRLRVYQVRTQDPTGKACPPFLRRVFEGFPCYETWKTVMQRFGVFTFEKDESGVPRILWKPGEKNQDKVEVTRWSWDRKKGTFTPTDWEQDTPQPVEEF